MYEQLITDQCIPKSGMHNSSCKCKKCHPWIGRITYKRLKGILDNNWWANQRPLANVVDIEPKFKTEQLHIPVMEKEVVPTWVDADSPMFQTLRLDIYGYRVFYDKYSFTREAEHMAWQSFYLAMITKVNEQRIFVEGAYNKTPF